MVIVIHVHVVTIKLWTEIEGEINILCKTRFEKNWTLGRRCEKEKLFMGGLKCETNDFVTLVKPSGGMAAWVITVRQWAGN